VIVYRLVVGGAKPLNMENKKLVQFLELFVILPALIAFMPIESLPMVEAGPEIVYTKQKNTEDLKLKALAIDAYFSAYEMPLSGLGLKMVEEAEKNKLDWRLLPAISVRESTGGKFACKKVKYNSFGWGSCKIGFESNEQAIEILARNLGGNNPKLAFYYANKDVEGILRSYNPKSVVPKYAEQVMSIMDRIEKEYIKLK
jgi:hypothetical protein